jgi:hypothetical protein
MHLLTICTEQILILRFPSLCYSPIGKISKPSSKNSASYSKNIAPENGNQDPLTIAQVANPESPWQS